MAILAAHPGLKVEVVVDGEELEEYVDDGAAQDAGIAATYVQAGSEAFFAIRYSLPKSLFVKNDILAKIKIDGVKMRSPVLRRKGAKRAGVIGIWSTTATAESTDGKAVARKFQFAKIKTTEDGQDIDLALERRLAEVGLISVSLHEVTTRFRLNTCADKIPVLESQDSIPEKALKGVDATHQAQLGPLQPERPRSHWRVEHVGDRRAPLATFNFKYRSLEGLKVLGVIPRTPSPVPLEDRPVEELNQSELADLVTRYRANEAEARNIKRERANAIKRELDFSHGFDDDDELTVVEERPRKRQNRPREDDEVIVLD